MRMFIAIELDESAKSCVEMAQAKMKSYSKKGNFTPVENFHLTLRFLGEMNADDAELLKMAVMETAAKNKKFPIELKNAGFFQRGENVIAWMGVSDNKELQQLYSRLEKNLEKQGFQKERRGLRPHITIGREVVTAASWDKIKKECECMHMSMKVSYITLMESVRQGAKMVYRPVLKAELK